MVFCVHLLLFFFRFCRGQLTSVEVFHNASWATQSSADVSIFEGIVHSKLECVPSTADRGPSMLLFPAGALLRLCWNRYRELLLWFFGKMLNLCTTSNIQVTMFSAVCLSYRGMVVRFNVFNCQYLVMKWQETPRDDSVARLVHASAVSVMQLISSNIFTLEERGDFNYYTKINISFRLLILLQTFYFCFLTYHQIIVLNSNFNIIS